jgi:hypothetical protein
LLPDKQNKLSAAPTDEGAYRRAYADRFLARGSRGVFQQAAVTGLAPISGSLITLMLVYFSAIQTPL